MNKKPLAARVFSKLNTYPTSIVGLLWPPIVALMAGASYCGMMGLCTLLAGSELKDGTASWSALLFGFLGILLVPEHLQQSLGTTPFLLLIFFCHGAALGLIVGILFYFYILSKVPDHDWQCRSCQKINLARRGWCRFCYCSAYPTDKQIEFCRKQSCSKQTENPAPLHRSESEAPPGTNTG
ncbi:hypothetical protein [Amphibiibacter pelophylacis]|uniref:Uncharacterized protein n=1 Tax=Amphibiibacter pelophylacis TaxID=1799477 RepID=A0ACC6NZM3_9BURK